MAQPIRLEHLHWYTRAPSTPIRILLNPYTFLSGYTFRPHTTGESDLRIRKLLNPLSRVETFESDIFSDTCGRSNSDTFESDDVAKDLIQSLRSSRPRAYKTTWQPTKTFLLFLLGRDFLARLPICILVSL